MENIPVDVLRGLLSNDKIPNEFIFEMFGEGIIDNIEKVVVENKKLSSTILQLEKKLRDAEEVIHFFKNKCMIDQEEETISLSPFIDTDVTPTEVFDRNYYINELMRIEKKIAFYDIRQHHIYIDLKGSDVISKPEYQLPDSTRTYYGEVHLSKAKLILEYLTRINNIDTSIFKKMSNELLIYTKDYHKVEYDIYRMVSIEPINMIDFRNDNIGYTIDNKFIDECISDIFNGYNCDDDTLSIITKYSIKWALELIPSSGTYKYHIDEINRIKKYNHLSFQTMYEIKLTEIAYELHNIFYKKIKDVYKKIEDKYNSIPEDFDDFDKLMNEVLDNEIEIDMLEEFDYKRRKLQLREFKARGYHIHWHLF